MKSVKVEESSTNLMGFLIQDLLDYAQIKAGKFRKNIKKFNIREAVQSVIDIQYRQANTRGLKLFSEFIDIPEVCIINSDEARIKQVLLGLQSNALKFTEEGQVKIGVSIEGKTLKFDVSDTGIGIPEDSKDKMFKLFGFLKDTKQLNTKGIGLGLIISQQIVNKFNGKVSFTSEEG